MRILIAADLLELPLRPASCAAAVASYSLHHLPRERFDDALAELGAVLRPGGVLVVSTHGGSGQEWIERPAGRVLLCRYTPTSWPDGCADAGSGMPIR